MPRFPGPTRRNNPTPPSPTAATRTGREMRRHLQTHPRVAYFDLDGTLMEGYSALLAGFYLLRQRRVSLGPILSSVLHLARYKAQRADYSAILRDGIQPWLGTRHEDLMALSAECFEAVVRPRIYREGQARLDKFRASGVPVVLISSTSPFLLGEVSRHLSCDDFIATRFEFDEEDRLTDQIVGIPVFGEGKRVMAEADARSRNARLSECAFFSDSASDLPLMRAVGYPYTVNPDRPLRAAARRHGWPILRYRQQIGR